MFKPEMIKKVPPEMVQHLDPEDGSLVEYDGELLDPLEAGHRAADEQQIRDELEKLKAEEWRQREKDMAEDREDMERTYRPRPDDSGDEDKK